MKTPSEFIQEWIETVCSNDASKIANLYQEDAILLGTLDKSVREGRNKIRAVSYTHLTLPTKRIV